MEVSFEYTPQQQYFVIRLDPSAHGCTPPMGELRFWGVASTPELSLASVAALLVLQHHPASIISLRDTAMSGPICTALTRHFGLELYPSSYDLQRRDLFSGEKMVAPLRFGQPHGRGWAADRFEVMPWCSLNDFGGLQGAKLRTNIDAFDLQEWEKSIIVALCCSGAQLGHILVENVPEAVRILFHRLGLEVLE